MASFISSTPPNYAQRKCRKNINAYDVQNVSPLFRVLANIQKHKAPKEDISHRKIRTATYLCSMMIGTR